VTGEVTTTDEVGAGTLEPGQEATTTTSETGATGDPGEETTTTDGDGVEGGSTLPYTGVGDMTMGGLAGIVLASGLVLLLLVRRRSSED
jgi:LPXTG-motif cell wall-anchored protein